MRQLHEDMYEDFRVYKNTIEDLIDRQVEDYEFGEIMTQLSDEINEGLQITIEESLRNNGYFDNPNQIDMDME